MDIADSKQMEKASSVISKFINIYSTNKVKANAMKNYALIEELLGRVCHKKRMPYFCVGSNFETSNSQQDSDFDQMLLCYNTEVCMRYPSEINYIHDNVFITDNSHCSPGYTKLVPHKLDNDSYIMYDFVTNSGCLIKDLLVIHPHDKKQYLSSDKMVEYLLKLRTEKTKQTQTTYRHGPCATCDVFSRTNLVLIDTTCGIPLNCWPPEANEWLTRERKHGWPSQLLIDKIQKQACHVVPVGDKCSDDKNIQWRVSFVLGERELVWSFNETQLHCLVVVKRLLSAIINLFPDELSSYQMKNILFWQMEKTDQTFWCAGNLLQCVKMCLVSFKDCVLKGAIFHYIDRKKNLLRDKLQDGNMKTRVVSHIDELLDNIFYFILSRLKLLRLINIWEDSQQNMTKFLEICSEKPFTLQTDEDLIMKEARDQHIIVREHVYVKAYASGDIRSLTEQLDALERDTKINIRYTRVISDVFRVRLGIEIYKKYLKVTSSESVAKGIQLSVSHRFLSNAVDLDGMSGKLYLATFYLMTKDHDSSNYLIDSVLYGKDRDLFYPGCACAFCFRAVGIQTKTNGDTRFLVNYQHSALRQSDVAYDVIYGPDDAAFVPLALQFECMTRKDVYDIIRIHPLVYALYLAFSNRHQQQDEAGSKKFLKDLQNVVPNAVWANDKGIYCTEEWNILGHCYSEVGDAHQAMACYRTSLGKTTPEYIITNAALYHVIILIFNTKYWSKKDRCSSRERYDVLHSRE